MEKQRIVMLLGQFEVRVGEKKRIAFPKKFKEVLGEKLIITQGFEKSLIVVSEKSWTQLLEGTEGKPFTIESARETQRFLLGGAAFVELDSKGRFVLPEYLKDYAEIGVDVVFVGMYRYVEIWEKTRWDLYRKNLEKNISVIAERLTKGDTKDD